MGYEPISIFREPLYILRKNCDIQEESSQVGGMWIRRSAAGLGGSGFCRGGHGSIDYVLTSEYDIEVAKSLRQHTVIS